MHPILIHIGPIPIRSYGFMIVCGFLVGVWLAIRRGRKVGITPETVIDLCFAILLSALIGSKLLHLIIFWPDYLVDIPRLRHHPIDLFVYLGSGLIFFGGLIAAIPTAIFFVRKRKLGIWTVADVLAPSIPLAHGFGRIGCFLAGCCFGKLCEAPWAVTFHNPNSMAPLGIPLHPTQLYSAFWNFSLAAILLLLGPRLKRSGQLFWMYILLYPIGRFVIEFYRADQRGFILSGALSTSQFIGIVLVLVAIAAQCVLLLHKPKSLKH
ncbi:prolipoprotein diacylglyceryl transferase [bacterium]|nr:prolipoprotein diacylglyceryl transferase [bacterium]